MQTQPMTILEFLDPSGRSPFNDWLLGLKDRKARAIIRTRLNRVRMGNLGNVRAVGKGVSELKIPFGPGYRIYFGMEQSALVVLLCGGDKSSQKDDIKQAQQLWAEYMR